MPATSAEVHRRVEESGEFSVESGLVSFGRTLGPHGGTCGVPNCERSTVAPPMTLGNVRELGVHLLAASCPNDSCRYQALVDVSAYPDKTLVPWFQLLIRCGKCGSRRPPELERAAGALDRSWQ